ncbi:GH36-type glycosyl hydrolase domain-containing protein [Pseudomonadota bacterium]
MLLKPSADGQRYELDSATAMPRACGFLWNRNMMLHVNCRGYVKAQHMQPEPGKYSYAPNLEERTFIQPEQPYYAHHPGRFVYIRDEQTGHLFSAPFEPVRHPPEQFEFSVGQQDILWRVRDSDIEIELMLSVPVDDVVELWSLNIRNGGDRDRRLSIYPFFSIGYMSWMNQSAVYNRELGAVVATCVTPYQKSEDAEHISTLKDKTFLLHDTPPDAWETSLDAFEGEGGLHRPDAIQQALLANGDALYETPAAVLQYRVELAAGSDQVFRFAFGPARAEEDIAQVRNRYLSKNGFEVAQAEYRAYLQTGKGCIRISTPDPGLDNYVNHWLGRQMFYHGDVNRMTTDPQTRNYLQDAMGMAYIQPPRSRAAFVLALSQQAASGAMPDGILLHEHAELKYINQVPHSDHCVWLPVCLQAYLDETADFDLLDQAITGSSDGSVATVAERITAAMRWMINDRDHRGLNFIAQGDWCDPMNGVGHKGRGVSAWLSIATVYALKCWSGVCKERGQKDLADEMRASAQEITAAVQKHLWDGDWFARGITDDNVIFGVSTDDEGRIFLNPQSWAMLAGIASEQQMEHMIAAVEEHLEGPHGVAVLSPAYTRMRADIGRLTQKYPGVTENGSVYNHAAAFYIYALFEQGLPDRAYRLLRKMIPGPDLEDYLQRGQLPVFIPNHYRGDWRRAPRTAGRSSQLFNTGTISWFYRILVDGLFGVKGCREGLEIKPQLPVDWAEASVTRDFRGARFNIHISRQPESSGTQIQVDGVRLPGHIISEPEPGQSYSVEVLL